MKPSLKLHAALGIKGVVLKGDVRNQCDVEEAIKTIIKGVVLKGDVRNQCDVEEAIKAIIKGVVLKGDVRNQCDVEEAIEGVDCVYHVASFGMSGRDQVSRIVVITLFEMFSGARNCDVSCQRWHACATCHTTWETCDTVLAFSMCRVRVILRL